MPSNTSTTSPDFDLIRHETGHITSDAIKLLWGLTQDEIKDRRRSINNLLNPTSGMGNIAFTNAVNIFIQNQILAGNAPKITFQSLLAVLYGSISSDVTGTFLASGAAGAVLSLYTNGSVSLGGSNQLNLAGTPVSITNGQLQFPAAQNPSSNVNTLDDYEEGTWTPTDASGASLTLTTPVGEYVKVGSLVMAAMAFTYPITANGAGMIIGGLPFTSKASANNMWGTFIAFSNTATALVIHGVVLANTTTSYFTLPSGVQPTNAQMSTASISAVTIYQAAA